MTTRLIWAIYIALLGVLLPHTAWLFGQFEPAGPLGTGAAWAGAGAFELAIAVLTHKLAGRLERTPRRLAGWRKLAYQYANAYAMGLLLSVGVSALANLAHAVEFGRGLAIFAQWGVKPAVYQIAFGAILPLVSLLFARVLSNAAEAEAAPDPELERLRSELVDIRRKLAQAESERKRLEVEKERSDKEREAAEKRFAAAGDLLAKIFAPEKRARILAVRQQWPALTISAIAVLTESSPGYVSDILKEREVAA